MYACCALSLCGHQAAILPFNEPFDANLWKETDSLKQGRGEAKIESQKEISQIRLQLLVAKSTSGALSVCRSMASRKIRKFKVNLTKFVFCKPVVGLVLLQTVCRFIAGFSQVRCRLFAVLGCSQSDDNNPSDSELGATGRQWVRSLVTRYSQGWSVCPPFCRSVCFSPLILFFLFHFSWFSLWFCLVFFRHSLLYSR